MSKEQPLEGDYYTKRLPDSAYIVQQREERQRLESEINKKEAALLDAQNAYKLMIELLASNEDALKEQIDLMKLQRPLGKTFDISFTLAVASKLVHIDFIAGNKNNASTLPAGVNVDFPFAKLYTLTIVNDGPGDIVYSTNESRNSSKATARLAANENYEDKFQFPTFETLNITLVSGSASAASVRIRGLA